MKAGAKAMHVHGYIANTNRKTYYCLERGASQTISYC